ncbi:MAG: response regulator transcription factor [Chitinophagaceae bacterium]|jgi:two-component system alkaline phosphatase synthesis response regulator PhoP|nr:response regulator transcription factor [Sediminibacterium sp.]
MEGSPIKILIADDEPDIVEIISFHLEKAGYIVASAKDGSEAIEKAKQFQPDCIILDIMMPKRNGFEVCEYLRSNKEFDNTFIVLLTALNDEASHIKGLELGGDDFVNKPISPKVLVSRINALFRRIQPVSSEKKIIQVKDLIIDATQYKTSINSKIFVLAKKEFELLYLLAAQPGRVFLRNEILSQVWGNDVIVGDRTIDVHVRKIRVKLGVDLITTVKGVGYKFDY